MLFKVMRLVLIAFASALIILQTDEFGHALMIDYRGLTVVLAILFIFFCDSVNRIFE